MVVLLINVVLPMHTLVPPVIAAGSAFTVTAAVAEQPLAVYEIVVVPAVTPVTTPLPSTVAVPVVLLIHEPPAVVLERVVVVPAHTLVVPIMAGTAGFTVIILVALDSDVW
jgi:hypothetical protein